MTKIDKLNVITLSVAIANSPLIDLGIGPSAIPAIRLVAGGILVISVILWILILILSYKKIWAFSCLSLFHFLWFAISIFMPVRDLLSPNLELSELFVSLNFSLLPLSTILLARLLPLGFAFGDRHVFRFFLPSILVSPIVFMYQSYLPISWLSASFLFFPPVYLLFFRNLHLRSSAGANVRITILFATTVLSLLSVASFSYQIFSRTLSITCLYASFILFLALINFIGLNKYFSLVLLPLLLLLTTRLPFVNQVLDAFQLKNDSVLDSAIINQAVSDYPFSSVLDLFSLGDNRSFVWVDLFSRGDLDLFFGNPGGILYSSFLYGGSERRGVEGFFANILMDYGLITLIVLIAFLLAIICSTSVSSLRLFYGKPLLSGNNMMKLMFDGPMSLLILLPLCFQCLAFYNPTASIAYVYMFLSVPVFLMGLSRR